ncbi:MAG: homoserine kinase [Planctomycetes bacterium]|nr:homoserine kinase [Planctomycetota bacterium]
MTATGRYAMKVRVPASTANLGSGFDVVGLALQLYLEVEAVPGGDGLKVELSGKYPGGIPKDKNNLIYRCIAEHAGDSLPQGMVLRIHNDIPLTRGLGSSASAIVAGITIGEWIRMGTPPERQPVLDAASRMEGHPDNVSAAVLGGLTVSAMIDDEVITNSLRVPYGLEIVAVIPERELPTQKAREILPLSIPRAEAVFNLQRLGLLLTGLFLNKKGMLYHGVADAIHQNRRAHLFPPMGEVLTAMNRDRDCYGAFISGAGPSIAAFTYGAGPRLGELGVKAFQKLGIPAEYRVLAPDYLGLTFF